MTTESDNSDIDVCTVEEDCSHTGLTIVAAETYIESTTATTTHVKGMKTTQLICIIVILLKTN